MKLYTKQGDAGITSLVNGERVSKTDERIELLGTIDELSAFIGLAKPLCENALREKLSAIQRELMQIMGIIAGAAHSNASFPSKQTEALEQEIDRMEALFVPPKGFVLYGACELSARLDVSGRVARRTERCYLKAMERFSLERAFLRYFNRLSDYLYLAARLAEQEEQKS